MTPDHPDRACAQKTLFFSYFLFPDDQHERDLLHLGVSYFATNFLIPVIKNATNILFLKRIIDMLLRSR